MTLAESFLWQNLRANALDHKFLRQHVIGDYIVDFVCRDDGLVIEVDGAYHAEREQHHDQCHVAIYIGNGQVCHASSPKTGIKVSSMYYRTPYKAVNIIGD